MSNFIRYKKYLFLIFAPAVIILGKFSYIVLVLCLFYLMYKEDDVFLRRNVIFILFYITSLAIFSHIMTVPLGRDENVYVTAGKLIQDGYKLYKDFAFPQMPYLPIIYAWLFKITSNSYYLLSARIFSFFCTIATMILIYFITYKILKSYIISIVLSLFFILNVPMVNTMGYAWNNMVALCFSLAGFLLYLSGVSERDRWVSIFLSGTFLSFAAGIKLFYFALFPAFIINSISIPVNRPFVKIFFPLSLGMLFGSIPILFFIFNSSMDIFAFNNLIYHKLNSLWYHYVGTINTLDFISKIRYARNLLKLPVISSCFVIFIFLLLFGRLKSGDRASLFRQPILCLCLFVTIFSTGIIFIPSPMHMQYFVMPIAFFIIFLACLCKYVFSKPNRYIELIFVAFAIHILIISSPRLFAKFNMLLRPNKWTPIMIHKIAVKLKDNIGYINQDGEIATLSPIYAIEAGLPIYTELATGVFMFRIGDFICEHSQHVYGIVSLKTLVRLLNNNPPRAIIVGKEPCLEDIFIDYAEKEGYYLIDGDFDGLKLYVRRKGRVL